VNAPPHFLPLLLSLWWALIGILWWALAFALRWALLIAWVAWWLWGVDWRKVWPVLARGAWAPVVLLIIVSALAWAEIVPSDYTLFNSATIRNFWWQMGAIVLLAAIAMLCGWLQGLLGWWPSASLEAQTSGSDHAHSSAVNGSHEYSH
jgi:hypothetical protein